jgi:hypothetical protein
VKRWPVSRGEPLRWEILVGDPGAAGLPPGRYLVELQDDPHFPPIGWKFSNLKVELERSAPETFPARLVGCGAEGFPGAGVDPADLVLEIRGTAGQSPVLMVLANRDFYQHPCRLEASIPAAAAAASKAGAPTRQTSVVQEPGFARAAVEIRDPGRTGLEAGSYTASLEPAAGSEEVYFTITLTNARISTIAPFSYRATLSGCPDGAAGAESAGIGRRGFTGRSEALADGSVRVELGSRAVPGCRAVATIPTKPDAGR